MLPLLFIIFLARATEKKRGNELMDSEGKITLIVVFTTAGRFLFLSGKKLSYKHIRKPTTPNIRLMTEIFKKKASFFFFVYLA